MGKRCLIQIIFFCISTVFFSYSQGHQMYKRQSEDNPGSSQPDFLPKGCGVSNSTKLNFAGRREAEKGAYPWMALILKEGRDGVRKPYCSAVLVTNIHVVTVAHCAVKRGGVDLDPSELTVRLGNHQLDGKDDGMNSVDVPVASIRTHENYDQATFKNDIAVLTLARPITFTRDISPICLPYNFLRGVDLTGRNGFVSGWGLNAFRKSSSDVLMEVSMPIVDQKECRRIFAKDLRITEEYLCAGTMDGDFCEGESGSPFMLPGKRSRYYLMGILSFGRTCGVPGYPEVYTRVTKYLDWLTEALS